MTRHIEVYSTEQTESFGRKLAAALEESGIKRAFIAMRGEMGVGKTAFTRGFASHFGIRCVKSPTYTVLNEYRGRAPIHHFDFYRIDGEDDLYSVGYFDVIENDGYTIGEWSENIADCIPDDALTLTISKPQNTDNTDMRYIDIDIPYDINAEFTGVDL